MAHFQVRIAFGQFSGRLPRTQQGAAEDSRQLSAVKRFCRLEGLKFSFAGQTESGETAVENPTRIVDLAVAHE